MKDINTSFTLNGTNYSINAEFYVDSDMNFEMVTLNLFNNDTDFEVVDFKASSILHPVSLESIISDEDLQKKIDSVILNEIDPGMAGW
jgi:hypothetical protein